MSKYPQFHVTRYSPQEGNPGEYWPEDVSVRDITGVSSVDLRHAKRMAVEGGNWDITAVDGSFYQITYIEEEGA